MKNNNVSINVRKNNGELVPFDQNKLFEALRRSGASKEHINLVEQQVRKEIYDGIPTKKILSSPTPSSETSQIIVQGDTD